MRTLDTRKCFPKTARWIVGLIVSATVLHFALVGMARAQSNCGERGYIVEQLQAKYGETRRSLGISGPNVVEVWASDGGSFTVLLTSPAGLSCLIAAGEAFEAAPAGTAGTGS